VISGTPQVPIFSVTATQPILSNVAAGINIAPDGTTLPAPPLGGTAVYLMALTSPNLFSDQLANTGSPDPNGVWLVDMANFDVFLYGVPAMGLARNLVIQFVDASTIGGPYFYSPSGGGIQFYPTQPLPINTDIGTFVFDINAARAIGLRTIDQIHIVNNTDATLEPQGWGSIWASYFPNGVQ
jgi:hypothetical protein